MVDTPPAGGGLKVKLPGGAEASLWGPNMLVLAGFLAVGAAMLYQGHLIRQEVRDQTSHFNQRVNDVEHEIERSCGREK